MSTWCAMFKSRLPWKLTKTKVMVPERTMEDEPEHILQEQKLVACSTCGRTFLPLPLKKHAPICEKTAAKKRRVFDSLKQRVEGTDLAQFHQKTYLKKQDSTPKTADKSKWEESHRKLVDAIRSAKGASKQMSTKKTPVATSTSSSNERCPFCERQFGPKAFERHVEWCKEHRTRVQKSPANVLLAKERLDARIKYKVPPLAKAKRLTVKEKYSTTSIPTKTESICSIKSTPPNPPLKRSLSIRKPKSVLDLGKTSKSVVELDKKTQAKSSRPKKYHEKVNTTLVNKKLESITVSPLKLVTWKEVTGKKSDGVIVVYENTKAFRNDDDLKEEVSDWEESVKEDEIVGEIETKAQSSPNVAIEDRFGFSDSEENYKTERVCVSDQEVPKSDDFSDGPSSSCLLYSEDSNRNLQYSYEDTDKTNPTSEEDLFGNQKMTILDEVRSQIDHDLSSSDIDGFDPKNELSDDEGLGKVVTVSSSSDCTKFTNSLFSFSSNSELRDKTSRNDLISLGTLKSDLCLMTDYDIPKKRRKLNTFTKDSQDKCEDGKCWLPTILTINPTKLKLENRNQEGNKSVVFKARFNRTTRNNVNIRKDIDGGAFLSYKSTTTPPYDPFASAERQFKELLECDLQTSQRPHTAITNTKPLAKKTVKSAVSSSKKRASVIDPPASFQDAEEFEVLENLINQQFNNELLNESFNIARKYSDTSSIDSSLINDNDNLLIPKHLKFDDYSSNDDDETDTTIRNTVESNKNETKSKAKTKKYCKNKTKSDCSYDEKGNNNKTSDEEVVEELFDVDDKLYAEYKIYEEMYLKEMEQKAGSKKQKVKNQVKSYGIEISNKISDDSAYGSLNRNTPNPKTTKLSPLQRKRIDSASSSGSENFANAPVTINQKMSKFCHECGNKYPLNTAKFCVECGVKRLVL